MNKIKDGSVIIFPTDTVYGIGAKLSDKAGQLRIYDIKKRSLNKRLSVLCSSLEEIEEFALVTEDAKKVINAFMPGAITVILKTKEEARSETILDTIGVRIPNHKLALEILKCNGPMATTSVNLSNEPPLNDYDEIVKTFGDLVDEVYPNSETPSRLASTVLNMSVEPICVIREGAITLDDIKKELNK